MVLITMMDFILRKDFFASYTLLALLASLRPLLSLFSFYWGAELADSPEKLRRNMLLAWFFGRVPFLFIPMIPSAWYIVFCVGSFQFFHRAGIPATMEILRLNIEKGEREKLFTTSFMLCFAEGALLGLGIGRILDGDTSLWYLLLISSTLLSLFSLYFQMNVPLPPLKKKKPQALKRHLLTPWIETYHLLVRRPDFFAFQLAFMFGGMGLMIMAPVKSIYFADHLHLTHEQVALARCFAMGLGVVASASIWRKGIHNYSQMTITAVMLLFFSLYPLMLLSIPYASELTLYVTLFFYGVAQSGSRLLWNLSGPLYAGDEESSRYSNTNVLTIGLRGLFGPLAGAFIYHTYGVEAALLTASILCFVGLLFAMWYVVVKEKRTEQDSNLQPPGPKPGTLSN